MWPFCWRDSSAPKLEFGLGKSLPIAQELRRKLQERIEEGKKFLERECMPTQSLAKLRRLTPFQGWEVDWSLLSPAPHTWVLALSPPLHTEAAPMLGLHMPPASHPHSNHLISDSPWGLTARLPTLPPASLPPAPAQVAGAGGQFGGEGWADPSASAVSNLHPWFLGKALQGISEAEKQEMAWRRVERVELVPGTPQTSFSSPLSSRGSWSGTGHKEKTQSSDIFTWPFQKLKKWSPWTSHLKHTCSP